MDMKIIPVTKLKNFYDSLSKLGLTTETQLCVLKDINTAKKYERLISLYEESKRHFKKYENIDEPFLPSDLSHRKDLPAYVQTITNTQDVISVLKETQDRNNKIQVDESSYDFIYLEREMPTSRTTNGITEDGIVGRSGSGGIDFIGFNSNDRLPVLGEIKVRSDQNTFYALIQLLTYLSEISTPHQIERINKDKLFKDIPNLTESASFYLYILLVNSDLGGIKKEILSETERLATRLEKGITEIRKIVFLKMHPETKDITIMESQENSCP